MELNEMNEPKCDLLPNPGTRVFWGVPSILLSSYVSMSWLLSPTPFHDGSLKPNA